MNSKPFDRNAVERQMHNGLTVEEFISKYEFKDEEEFVSQLARVYGTPSKAQKILRDIRKKTPKGQKKSSQESALEEALNVNNPAFVPVQNTQLIVPYNNVKTVSVIDEIQADMPVQTTQEFQITSQESELDKLKAKLADVKKDLSDIDNEIADYEHKYSDSMDEIIKSREILNGLYKQIATEKEKVKNYVGNVKLYEGKIKENKQLREITVEEMNGLEKQIRSLEVKTLYFGDNFNDEYNYNASNYEVSQESVMQKVTQLFAMGTYEEFSVSRLRQLANVLCTIDMVIAEDDNIEVLFETADNEIIEAVKNETKLVAKVK